MSARVLVAGTRQAVQVIRRIVGPDADVVAAYRTDEALRLLDERTDSLVCNVRFDESRMFDFLKAARSRFPRVRVVCCRVSTSELSPGVHHAIELALGTMGIRTFVDCAPLYREGGEAAAAEALRNAILAELPATRPTRS